MPASSKPLTELFGATPSTRLDWVYINRLLTELQSRIVELQILREGLTAVIAQAETIALERIDETLTPAVESVEAQLAALMALIEAAEGDLEEATTNAIAAVQDQIDEAVAGANAATTAANAAAGVATSAAGAAAAAAAGVDAAIASSIVDMAKTSVAQQFTKPQRASVTAVASATTMTIDLAANNDFEVTAYAHTGTLANPTNQATQIGQKGSIAITQDGSGGHPLAFASNWKPFGQSTAPSINTTAGVTSVIDYHVISATVIRYTLRAIGA